MGKQAVGIHCTSYNKRYDTFSHVLSYPQKPLIETKMMKYLNVDKLPNGINVIVAVLLHMPDIIKKIQSYLIKHQLIEDYLHQHFIVPTKKKKEKINCQEKKKNSL